MLQSYQSISSLGFFEAPMAPPDIVPLENGDVDITFNVEREADRIHQLRHLGRRRRGPLRLHRVRTAEPLRSGQIGDPPLGLRTLPQQLRVELLRPGALPEPDLGVPLAVQLPRPVLPVLDRPTASGSARTSASASRGRSSRCTRVFVGYGISRTKYELFDDVDDTSLFGRPPGVQSQLSLGVTRQTLDHPIFPTSGSRQNINVEVNGGLLGGDGDFTRVLARRAPGGCRSDSSAATHRRAGRSVRFALGLTLRAGAVFGDADAFPFDRFWMGGVQFGQQLRGYDETSITPLGYFPERSADIIDIDRLGNAFFSLTAEYAIRAQRPDLDGSPSSTTPETCGGIRARSTRPGSTAARASASSS